MNLEIRLLGEKIEDLLKEAGIPEVLRPLISKMGGIVAGTSWARHITVFNNKDTIATGEDMSYETNTASTMFLLLWKQHTQKLLRIISINGVVIPDNECLAVEWSPKEEQAIKQLAEETDLTNAGVLRQALRHYQYHQFRVKQGNQPAWLDEQGQRIPETGGGCMGD